MLSLEEISDRFEIQQLLIDYSTAIDRRQFDDLDRVFTSDAYIDYRAMGGIDGRFPEVKAWLDAHPRVQFHFTPTSASWLNQVEGFFGILGKQSLSETDFPSKKALREHLAAYMRSWNKDPTPFAWTKPANAIIKSHRRMLDRISTAVH